MVKPNLPRLRLRFPRLITLMNFEDKGLNQRFYSLQRTWAPTLCIPVRMNTRCQGAVLQFGSTRQKQRDASPISAQSDCFVLPSSPLGSLLVAFHCIPAITPLLTPSSASLRNDGKSTPLVYTTLQALVATLSGLGPILSVSAPSVGGGISDPRHRAG